MANTPKGTELLGTTRGLAWLRQFEEPDRPIAALLAERLKLISNAQFTRGLFSEFDATVEAANAKTTATAFFAIREAPKPTIVYTNKGIGLYRYNSPYFHGADSMARPSAAAQGAGMGSEGITAGIIRDYVAKRGKPSLMDHPSIEQMRAVKPRHFVLVDDLIGSGQRAENFVRWFVSHPTIRSWMSYGLCSIAVVAYAGTQVGVSRVTSLKSVSQVRVRQPLVHGSALWGKRVQEQVIDLCSRYGQLTRRQGMSVGYQSAFTTIVFEHKCPNTAPAILWAKSSAWSPLFDVRPNLGYPVWPRAQDGKKARSKYFDLLGRKRLAASRIILANDEERALRMKALAALGRGFRSKRKLSDVLGQELPITTDVLDSLVSLGMITSDWRLTDSGRMELRVAQRMGVVEEQTDQVDQSERFYYPTQLRSSQRPV